MKSFLFFIFLVTCGCSTHDESTPPERYLDLSLRLPPLAESEQHELLSQIDYYQITFEGDRWNITKRIDRQEVVSQIFNDIPQGGHIHIVVKGFNNIDQLLLYGEYNVDYDKEKKVELQLKKSEG